MPSYPFLDRAPAWALFAILWALLSLAVEVGRRVGMLRASFRSGAKPQAMGTIVAATLGLFAFVLSFTFGASFARFDVRRSLVIRDANAIGTTYLRASLLPSPHDVAVRELLRRYVEVRAAPPGPDELVTALDQTQAIQNALWVEAVAASREAPTPITALFTASLNDVIDLHTERVTYAAESRIPQMIWIDLALLGLFSLTLLGYHSGVARSRTPIALVLIALAFATVLLIIVQLDRPYGGFSVSQAAMASVRRMMAR